MKYICLICGYVYDEEVGETGNNIPKDTPWERVPSDWKCPVCQAPKSQFRPVSQPDEPKEATPAEIVLSLPDQITYTNAEKSVIFSNLAKGWEKQYKPEASELCLRLSDYFQSKVVPETERDTARLMDLLEKDVDSHFQAARDLAAQKADRGALRALKWSEQVSRMTSAHLSDLLYNPKAFLNDTNAFVCDICGFIHIGDDKPEICPVCKVPSMKMTLIERGA